MAHRNIKITRDIVQTCNKLRTFNKLDQSLLQPHKSIETSKNASYDVKSNEIHSSTSCQHEATNPNLISSELNANKYLNSKKIPETQFVVINTKNFETEITGRTISFPLRTSTRSYSSNSKKDDPSCKPSKKCVRNPHCPKFSIEDCTPSKGSNCKRLYQDPHCTKKMAPYPSYSELCAFRMEEDPSECHQCPWQKCRGVDDIKPQGKKSYHTSTREMNMAMIPTATSKFIPLIFPNECDAKKEPCKEPPPKCNKENRVKKEKCPEKKKKQEKKCELMGNEPWIISGSLQNLELQKFYHDKSRALFCEHFENRLTLAEKIMYRFKDCPDEERKCPKFEIVPPKLDHRINQQFAILLGGKEHDKGHPPPCEQPNHPSSRQCPSDTPKKKYKHERDLYESEYRRNPKPYSDDDLKKY